MCLGSKTKKKRFHTSRWDHNTTSFKTWSSRDSSTRDNFFIILCISLYFFISKFVKKIQTSSNKPAIHNVTKKLKKDSDTLQQMLQMFISLNISMLNILNELKQVVKSRVIKGYQSMSKERLLSARC